MVTKNVPDADDSLPLSERMTKLTPHQCFLERLVEEGKFEAFKARRMDLYRSKQVPTYAQTFALAAPEFGFQLDKEIEWYRERLQNKERATAAKYTDQVETVQEENDDRVKNLKKINKIETKPGWSYKDDVRWLYENWGRVIKLDPHTKKWRVDYYALRRAPSRGVLTLAEWAKDNQNEFLTKLCNKYLIEEKKPGSDGGPAGDDDPGRSELDDFMRQFQS